MKIIKTPKYVRDIKTKLIRKNKVKELEKIVLIENLLVHTDNMKKLLLNPLAKTYNIEKKKGNLKYYYTARLNNKLRLFIRPIGDYPYDLNQIVEIELIKIDNKHYGDG